MKSNNYSQKILFLNALAAALLFGACSQVSKEDLPEYQNPNNVTKTEATPGVVVGSFSSDAAGDQIMSASVASNIAEVSVTIPEGALAESLAIEFQEGAAIDTLPTELGIDLGSDLVYGSTPIFIETSSDTNLQLPMQINIPLPGDEIARAVSDNSSSLTLQGTTGKVVMLSVMRKSDGSRTYSISITVMTTEHLDGLIVRYSATNWGWFRILGLTDAVGETTIDAEFTPSGAIATSIR